MKAIMLSIQPQHCENICTVVGEENGKPIYKKAVEVRKTRPQIDTPFKCYIYCTKGKVDKRGRHLHIIEPRKRKEYGIVEEWSNDTRATLIVNGDYMAYESYLADGKVIGSFVCDKVDTIERDFNDWLPKERYEVTSEQLSAMCLTEAELWDYGKGKLLYGWHISDLKIYDKPKELGEFAQYKKGIHFHKCEKWNEDCRYYEYEDDVRDQGSCCSWKDLCPLTRPPQSWCYVEPLEENS